MNMYTVVYNEYIKDLVIAHDENEAKEVMKAFNIDACTMIDPKIYDTLPIVQVSDDLQFMTDKGLVTIREIIAACNEPTYWLAVDDKHLEFL